MQRAERADLCDGMWPAEGRPALLAALRDLDPLDAEAAGAVAAPLSPAPAARLLAPLRPTGILMRLFDEAIGGEELPDAPHVVWHAAWSAPGDPSQATVQGSEHGFGQFEAGDSAELAAWPDRGPIGI